MECREFDELASLDLSGELEPAKRVEYDRHLEGCTACATRLALQRRADDLLRTSLSASPSPIAAAAVVARVRERMQARPWWRRIFEMYGAGPLPVYAVAAIALLIAIGLHPTLRSDPRAYLLDT